ncbi:MAG: DUF4294 domain-containing protein [Bacteroidetes bacterium]|nr:MAG: DUF4294 domain-containing protein [Bacteroidota bacterium]
MRQIVIAIVFLFFGSSVFAQKDSIIQYASKNRNNIMDAIIVDGDTIPIFVLDEVLLVDKPTFNSNEARRRYFILKRKVMKVYPYAVIAGNKLDSLNLTLVGKSKRKRKKLIKEFNDYLKDEFEDEMVKLTHNEGQILSKLVYRETGMSSYDLIKNYRSGWNAFWWNGIAYFNKIDLKTPYAPTQDEEDKLIEGILNRAFIEGRLKERVPITSLIPVN